MDDSQEKSSVSQREKPQSSGLWLVRHGALPDNPLRRMVGAQDIPLSPTGKAQMRQLAKDLMPRIFPKLSCVLTSDLLRCQESTELLLRNCPTTLPIHVEPKLREISLGLWEGHSKTEINTLWPGSWALRGQFLQSYVPENGESFRMLIRRVLAALAFWQKRYPQGDLLIVSHAGVLRSLLALYLALPLNQLLRIPLSYASICYLPGNFAQNTGKTA